MKIKLSVITDALDMIWDEWVINLNKETGEIINLPHEAFAIAEDFESEEEVETAVSRAEIDMDEDDVALAYSILSQPDKFACLPDRFDINEYEIMRDFAQSYEDEQISSELCNAIIGRGAFRRFKDTLIRLDIREEYFAFKNKALEKIAKDWCEVNKIDYFEE